MLLIPVCSFLITIALTLVFRRVAVGFGFLDHPNSRKFHKAPTPLMGGAAIFLGFWITIGAGLFLTKQFPFLVPQFLRGFIPGVWIRMPWIMAIFVGALVISGVGLWDDKKVIGPYKKLLYQLIVAIFLVFSGVRVRMFLPEYLSYIISVIWIVAITNAFNLLDNMDGVSAGIAFVCSFLFLISAVLMSNYFVAVFLLAFMGALAGFLVLNFHPASIFMGDCGSLFIGFIMSIVGILGTYYGADSPTLYPVVTPLLILAVPLFDIFSVMAIRIRRGVSIFAADKNHFSHRLVDIGMNVRTAAVFLYIVTFCVGLPSVLLPLLPAKGVMIVFVQTLGVMSIIGILEYYGKKR